MSPRSTPGSGVAWGAGAPPALARVLVKLVLNLVLCTLILDALQPGMDEVQTYGESLAAGGADATAPRTVTNLFFPPAVSLSALTLATVLAVFKPWGRVRSHRSG